MKYYLFKHSHKENLHYADNLARLSGIFWWIDVAWCLTYIVGLVIVDNEVINHPVEHPVAVAVVVGYYLGISLMACFTLISIFLNIYSS